MTPVAIRLLAQKGLSAHDIAEIAEALVPPRSSGAERQARYRQRKKASERNDSDVTGDVTPPLNENILIPPGSPPLASANGPTPSENFVSVWNAERGLRPARKLAGQRLAKFNRRRKEFGDETLLDAVRRLGASPFHCGKNDREWQADIGWFLRSDDNVTKALELPEPPKAAAPVDAAESAERAAALYRRMGRDDDAAEAEKRAERLRSSATGPPRPIGEVLRSASAPR